MRAKIDLSENSPGWKFSEYEMKSILTEHTGFIKSMWCGDLACEEKIKEETGMPSRCMPFEQEHIADVCPVCGKPAHKMVVWGIAY